ncbi:MAG: hypothetical protein MJZ16_14110 [Bacteroidales bacterium]|nr:hypothetical protein [Bacteroidales bacterium]
MMTITISANGKTRTAAPANFGKEEALDLTIDYMGMDLTITGTETGTSITVPYSAIKTLASIVEGDDRK